MRRCDLSSHARDALNAPNETHLTSENDFEKLHYISNTRVNQRRDRLPSHQSCYRNALYIFSTFTRLQLSRIPLIPNSKAFLNSSSFRSLPVRSSRPLRDPGTSFGTGMKSAYVIPPSPSSRSNDSPCNVIRFASEREHIQGGERDGFG